MDGARPTPDTSAGEVLAELSRRYKRFKLRNANYARLITFLCFVALFLATLFLQRNAHVSYQVYSTVASGLLPNADAIATTDDIYSWLAELLQNVWKDPVCGDGVCEVPFEYAAYGRFGCRADCGRLQDIQNLTAIQLDLYFDFNHPPGSIPATELMNNAAWNLCPQTGTGGCYWAEDQTFDRLAGSISIVVPDVPDGSWALAIKRDIFDKVRGAVRIVPLLEEQALAEKVRIALEGAAAYRNGEAAALQEVVDIAGEDLVELLNATLAQRYEEELDTAQAALDSGLWDPATYSSHVAALQLGRKEELREMEEVAQFCPQLPFNVSDPEVPAEYLDTCIKYSNMTEEARDAQLDAMRRLVNLRLVPLRGRMDAVLTAGLQRLVNAAPEVYTVVGSCYGTDGLEPKQASASALAQFYVEGPYLMPPSAKAALSTFLISSSAMTVEELAARAQARINEINAAAATVLALPEVQFALNLSRDANYNFVSWDGGSDAYETCNLESRMPQYAGTCAKRLECSSTQVVNGGDTRVVYSCPTASPPLDSDACGDACDTQQLCQALCTCEPGCAAGEVCTCTACTKVPSARTEADYLAMVAQSAVLSSLDLSLVGGSSGSSGPRRSLQASMLDSILAAVGQLEASQAALAQDVQQLESQVQAANAAEATSTLESLISTGQQQILVGQSRVQALLTEIIGKQDAAASAQAATAQALANLQTLQQQQLQAQQQLEQANKDKVEAIKAALQQGLLSLSQALELFRQARVQNLQLSRNALLATEPCTTQTAVEHAFKVDQYDEVSLDTSRVRHLGLTNRVLAGLLLFTQRDVYRNCSARFSDIDNRCDGGLDLHPFGVDPVFKLGTSLYDPDLDNTGDMVSYYNCSALPQATYNVTQDDGQGQRITNVEPFCADLFNPRNLPYGFHSMRLRRFGDGFPAVLDINLSQDDVLRWLGFLQEGLYLGSLTRSMLAQLVTYNTQLHLFSASSIVFDFSNSGSVQVSYAIETLRVELYVTPTDKLRLAMEVVLVLCIAWMAFVEIRGLCTATVQKRCWNPLLYFHGAWHLVDFCSTALLVATVIMWIAILTAAAKFRINLRYDVYEDLQAEAAFLTLRSDGTGLQDMHDAFGSLQDLSDRLSWYYALNGINLLLLIIRMLKLFDFQPRLGVVTRSLAHAGPDLVHFCLVFSLVFVGYAMLAHLIFGSGIEGFSSFGRAVETCFAILLGDISVNDDLKALSGLQAAAGALFFWSFEILVFMVLLNFLLAIIVESFGEVKSRTTDTTGIQTELAQVIAHLYHSALGRARGVRINDEALEELLGDSEDKSRSRSRGSGGSSSDGSEPEDPAASKRLLVAGKEVSEHQLESLLQANMLHGDSDIESHPGSPSKRRLLGGSSMGLFHARHAAPNKHGAAAADAHQLAHYVMLRFGEDLRAKVAAARGGQEGAAQPLEPAQPQQESQFSIPAVRGSHETDSLVERDRAVLGGGNGQRLAGRIRAEAEQAGVQAALSSLLELHQGLREQQQTMLSLQSALLQQQAEVVQALGCEGREGEGLQLPPGPELSSGELGAAQEQRGEGRRGAARRGQLRSLGSLAAVSLHRQVPEGG